MDSALSITFEVPGMNEIINKFRQNNIALLDETFNEDKDHDIVAVDMLIGIDIMLYMSSVTWNKVLGGSCMVINNEMAPIGNVFNFLRGPAVLRGYYFIYRVLSTTLLSGIKCTMWNYMTPLSSPHPPKKYPHPPFYGKKKVFFKNYLLLC